MPLFPFLLLISSILTSNNDYVTNGDITLCESQTDPSEDNCKGHSTEDYACCFGKYTGGSQCFKIQRNYRFALDSLSTFINENGNEYPNITFSCNQASAKCGTDNPGEIFQCREHSSNKNSCCYIEKGDKTDCILADSKFPNQTINETIGGTLVVCGGYFYRMNIVYFILFFIILNYN